MGSNFDHKPVMMAQVLEWLRPQAGGRYADGTLGGGGHAEAILAASSPSGWLYGCDRDGDAVEHTRQRLAQFAGRFELRRENFAELATWVPSGSLDGVLLDLGVSSPQLDRADRGFSFQQRGPLDMRMDRRQETTAADLVNSASVEELARIFWELGGERDSRRFARAIGKEREHRRFETTGQLADLIARITPRGARKAHPATKVFLALRLAVNDEISSLERGLAGALTILKPAGRLVVISFHSLEDRVVKNFGRARALGYTYAGDVDVPELRKPRSPEIKWVVRRAIKPPAQELVENPRSRSAQMRVIEKM